MRVALLSNLILSALIANNMPAGALAQSAVPAPSTSTADAVSKAAATAKPAFKPVNETNFKAAREKLLAAIDELDRYLNASGANGAAWKKYLRWDDMQEQVKAGVEGKTNVLREISLQYYTDHVGLELPQFAAVGRLLRTYANVLYSAREANLQQQFDAKLEELTQLLDAYAKDPSELSASAISSTLSWLERNGQADDLLAVVRTRFTRPNLFVTVSEDLVVYDLRRKIDEDTPITDYILDTRIRGTGHTVGKLDARLVPDDKRAVLDLFLKGQTASRTVGTNRSAVIRSVGNTSIAGVKRVWFDETGIKGGPSQADAKTANNVVGIGSTRGGIGGCLVTRIATKKVAQSKGQAEAIGSEHAEARIRGRLDSEAAKQLAAVNRDWQVKVRDPLTRSNIYPQIFNFSSTPDNVNLVVLQADQAQLGAPTAPSTINGQHDVAVRAHQSVVNNATASMFSGRTLTDEHIRAEVIKRRGSLPDEMKNDEDKDPWSITFADEQPVSFQIDNGGFRVTVRGKRFTSGERKFKAMNVTASYTAERNGKGLKLVRQGDLEIFPPGFNRETDKFSIDQVALRSILQKKFGKMFKAEIVTEGLELPGKYKSWGKLPLTTYSFDKGWALLVWDRESTRVASAKTAEAAK
jgi:hypothetical protein